MLLLTACVLQTAIRVEVLNARAGHYLPRADRNRDGTLADGKWRRSPDNSPRDQLRDLVIKIRSAAVSSGPGSAYSSRRDTAEDETTMG
jgi:hypothetical protein